jgi:Kef-type K+ transport system membrane component KefB
VAAGSQFGQLVLAGASIADVSTIVLLSLLFSGERGGIGSKLVLLGFASTSTVARVTIFLAALLAVRGLPALLYRPLIGRRRADAAGLLHATSLSFLVVASRLGVELGLLSPRTPRRWSRPACSRCSSSRSPR